jgi:hypothetical protein
MGKSEGCSAANLRLLTTTAVKLMALWFCSSSHSPQALAWGWTELLFSNRFNGFSNLPLTSEGSVHQETVETVIKFVPAANPQAKAWGE